MLSVRKYQVVRPRMLQQIFCCTHFVCITHYRAMASSLRWLVGTLVVLFSFTITPGVGWSQEELDLFDLVEEIGENFYHLMQIDEDASSAEIRRAYRQLSLQLHPDKSDDPDAAEKFRNMVAVSDILKDEEMREIYDQILVDGLPDWKQPLFYYRRMRKMGLLELGVLLLLMMSVAHYLYGWAVFAEKQIVLQDVLRRKQKKEQKKSRNNKTQQTYQRLEAEVKMLTAQAQESIPHLKDLLPVVLAKGFIWLLILGWKVLGQRMERWNDRSGKKEMEEEEERKEEEGGEEVEEKGGKEEEKAEVEGGLGEEGEGGKEVLGEEEEGGEKEDKMEGSRNGGIVEEREVDIKTSSEVAETSTPNQSNNILNQLSSADDSHHNHGNRVNSLTGSRGKGKVRKPRTKVSPSYVECNSYEGPSIQDTAISHEELRTEVNVQTSVSQGKAKKLESTGRNKAEQGPQNASYEETITKSPPSDVDLSNSVSPSSRTNGRCEGTGAVGATVAPTSGAQMWSQFQQKQLEWALARYPKFSEQRWPNVAKSVPGKTQEECMERCKQIYAELRHKRTSTTTQ